MICGLCTEFYTNCFCEGLCSIENRVQMLYVLSLPGLILPIAGIKGILARTMEFLYDFYIVLLLYHTKIVRSTFGVYTVRAARRLNRQLFYLSLNECGGPRQKQFV